MSDNELLKMIPFVAMVIFKTWTLYSCYLVCRFFRIHYAIGVLIFFFPIVNVLVTLFPFYYWIDKIFITKSKQKENVKEIEVVDPKNLNESEIINFDTDKGRITIQNIYRGVYIQGGAGSGKSKSLIEPIIYQASENSMAGLLYDFKSPELTKKLLSAYKKQTEINTYFVDFKNPTRSNRVNPISPKYLTKSAVAFELSQTLINNLLPETIKKREYFDREAQSILTGIIWYMRNNHPQFCTIPHIISLFAHISIDKILEMVASDSEAIGMISSIKQAVDRNANRLVASVMSTLQNALATLNNPEVFWILSGEDFSLDLNDPEDPKFMCIGNDSTLSATYAPVISLIISSAIRLMNQPDKHKSMILLDEAPTIYIPKFEQIPATARSNKVATIYAAQDFGQVEDQNGKDKAQVLLSNLGTQIYGRSTNVKTAEIIKSIFSKQDKSFWAESQNSGKAGGLVLKMGRNDSEGRSQSIQERDRVKVTDILNLNAGEFYGIIAEGKPREFLKTKFKIAEQMDESHNFGIKTPMEYLGKNYQRIVDEVLSLTKDDQKNDNLINF